jgi:BEN domain
VFSSGVAMTAKQSSFLILIPNTVERDSKFINCVLDIVFGAHVLAISSLTGMSTKSATVLKLDPEKLEVVKGEH